MRKIEQDMESAFDEMKGIRALTDSLQASFDSHKALRKHLEAKIENLTMKSENGISVKAEIAEAKTEMHLHACQANKIKNDIRKLNDMLEEAKKKNKKIEIFVRMPLTSTAQQQPKIQRAPGSLMCRFAEIIVSKKRYERDCQAALADWHEEYFEALDQGRGKAKMAAIRIRHTWGFLKAIGCLVALETLGKLASKLIAKIGGA